jgi:CRP-like cAMP-binding protein
VLIERGVAKVSAHAADGRDALLSIRVGGDLVGEMSALGTTPRSATVTMCGSGLVRLIHGREFQPFLRAHPDVAIQLAAMVADRLRWSNQRRIDFGAYPVKGRLARILADMAMMHGVAGPAGVQIAVRLTQPELATMCGAAEISVQKALRELRRAGLLHTGYGRITVRDPTALRAVAET